MTPLAKEEMQGCHLLGTAIFFLWVFSIPSILENILHDRDEKAESVRKKDVSEGRRSALLNSRWGKLKKSPLRAFHQTQDNSPVSMVLPLRVRM